MDKKRLKRLNDKRAASLKKQIPSSPVPQDPKPATSSSSVVGPSPRISIVESSRRSSEGEELDMYAMSRKWDPIIDAPPIQDVADPEDIGILNRLQTKNISDDLDGVPNPLALIEKAIANDLDTSMFKQEQFEVAENVIDWCRNPKFLGAKMDPFPRQFQAMVHFFSDVCFHCSDSDFIHDVPVDASMGECLDRFVLLKHGVCPQCKRNRTEILQEWQRDYRFPHYNSHLEERALASLRPVPPNEFVGVWGQRSGKSLMVSSFVWTYILHRYLAIPSLGSYFDQPDNIIFEASFVAPTLNQVKKYLWLPFRQAYFDSPWFRTLREWTVAEGKRVGIQLYKSEETFIVFFNKRIAIHVLAANSSTLRGGTRFFAAVDELGWTSSKEGNSQSAGVRDGREVFQALSNSLMTFRGQADTYRRDRLRDYNTLDGYMINISSPSSIADPIMERASYATSTPRIYYTHYATWEVNPKQKEALICEEFAADPERLSRDFYAIPPRATSPFIDDDAHIEQLTYKEEDIKLFEYKTDTFEDDAGNRYLRPIVSQIKGDPHTPRVLAVDNGEVKNSFAIIMARYYPEHDGVLYEECVEVAPHDGQSVDLAWCYDHFILPLVKSFNFLNIVYDRWNSAHAIHDLRTNHGMADAAIRFSLRRWKEFDDFRNDMYGSKLWFSKSEKPYEEILAQPKLHLRAAYPRAHFRAQILTVEQFNKKVFKPQGGNDDLFRCGVLCHVAIKKNIKEYRKKTRKVNYAGQPDAVGFFSSRGGTRTQASSGLRSRRGGGGNRRAFSYGGGAGGATGGGQGGPTSY